ncbi:MAG: nucleotide exchange factor GrpE [Hungatella sp.]|jgi:molecular chaperone GrpE (heat shock protein)|nr:nucleotide exchange factor GrpE [Hungatella sp.]
MIFGLIKKKFDFPVKKEFDSFSDRMELMESRQKKQENMLEEALELLDCCTETLSERNKKEETQWRQAGQRENDLLELIMTYGEYMENLRFYMKDQSFFGEEWDSQWKMMELSLKRTEEKCGIARIQDEGEPADPSRVEIIKKKTCPDVENHNHVGEIIIPGWIYKGTVIKKAKAVIWQYEGEK